MRGVVPACRSLDAMSIFALTAEDAARVRASRRNSTPPIRGRAPPRSRRTRWFRRARRRSVSPCRARRSSSSSATRRTRSLFDASRRSGCAISAAKPCEVDIEPLLEHRAAAL